MQEGWREVLGFVCRWCLLGLAVGVLLLAAWAAAAATRGIAPDLQAGMVVADSVWSLRNPMTPLLVGYPSPAGSFGDAPLLICGLDGKPWLLATNWQPRFYTFVYGAGPGANAVHVQGVPYGALAFQRASGTCLVARENETVWLIDARLALRMAGGRSAALRQCLSRLGRPDAHAVVALFDAGPVDDFVGRRQQLRQGGLKLPVVCTIRRDGDPMGTLWQAAANVNGPVAVVTDDEALAVRAAKDSRSRFRVHLISASGPSPPGLRRYKSLAKFEESLAAGSID